MKEAWGWIRDIAIAVVIAAVLLFFFKPIIIQQESMQPNFYSKDYVIVSKQAYKLFGDMERGDIIVFKSSLLDDNGQAQVSHQEDNRASGRYYCDRRRIRHT